MAVAKQKTPLKRPATKGSFKPGNQAALGNDKTLRYSTWIEKALDKIVPDSLEKYGEIISYRQALAEKLVNTATDEVDANVVLSYLKEIADRTEGKPQQRTDITSNGETLEGLIITKSE